ncbi:MAG: hypothetical protein H6721_29420 [Sandaracinus sp.]|nr:hypothetical protein [Sandaracinus sp.]MCB9636251.1 hypothetical protein [Sandaracinus sp.]
MNLRPVVLVALALAVGAFGCDDETWEPSSLGTSAAPPAPEPEVVRGAAPSGTARMPSLPAAPTPDQEAHIARLIEQSGGGGGGGGRGEMPELLRPYDRFGENAEGLSQEQAATLIGNVLAAGRNVIGQDVTPCDRILAMASTAAAASGDHPLDTAEVTRLCGQVPPEVLACIQPSGDQSPAEQRRCQNLLGQPSLIERTNEEDRTRIPRARSDESVRRLLGRRSAEEEAPPAGPRDRPLVVE